MAGHAKETRAYLLGELLHALRRTDALMQKSRPRLLGGRSSEVHGPLLNRFAQGEERGYWLFAGSGAWRE